MYVITSYNWRYYTLLVKCSQGSNFMPSMYEVSGPVLFGMYLVPVILSITLFSFIYKKGFY